VSLRYDLAETGERAAGQAAAAAALRRGEVVAVALDSGYALVADAFSAAGVAALRAARSRPDLRPQVLVGRIRGVAGIAAVPDDAAALMVDHWPGLLTLLLRAHPSLAWQVCPPGAAVAVRMPMHPAALELVGGFGPLAAVPAAAAGAQTLESIDEVVVGLPGVARVLLDSGHVPRLPGSTVVDAAVNPPRVVRLGAVSLAQLCATCPGMIHGAVPREGGPTQR
jgi:tRNA threonylcarbamoyl adenosine modification protein (Sua5/YciO/YrdC/YwlC family)